MRWLICGFDLILTLHHFEHFVYGIWGVLFGGFGGGLGVVCGGLDCLGWSRGGLGVVWSALG